MDENEIGSKRRRAVGSRVPIFLHIPKTGGSTLNRVIQREYAAEEIYTFRGPVAAQSIDRFAALPVSTRSAIRLVRGHFPLGVDRAIPGPSAYFTFLRDPVERAISSYYFIYRAEGHPLHEWMVRERLSLDQFVDSQRSAGVDNGQTRILSADPDAMYTVDADGVPYPPKVAIGDCDRGLLERAKRNLAERFVVVGQTERFDETALAICREFGWRLPLAERRNIGLNRPSDGVPPATRRRLEQRNELDRELHALAGELLERRLRHAGSAFRRDLHRVRLLNRLASSAPGGVLLGLRRRLRRGVRGAG